MRVKIPDISRQIYKEDVLGALKSKYSTIGTLWVSHQMEWTNRIYLMFKDHDKALIIIYLINKTLAFYSKNFIKLNYQEYHSKESLNIEKFNITEISKTLNIPKETTRRKISELQSNGIIKKNVRGCIIDKTVFPMLRPDNSIKSISGFLFIFSKIMIDEKILLNPVTSEELKKIIEKDFTYIWKIFYDMQITMMLNYKKIFKDLETWHIFGTCIVNQHLNTKKINEYNMDRENFIKSFTLNEVTIGINAMSISDITHIPRATVIRKLKKLLELKYLLIDKKKHYKISANVVKKLVPIQNNVLDNLANFSTAVYNSAILLIDKDL